MTDDHRLSDEVRMLAAMAYGEASAANDRLEMFALASVLRRQQLARQYPSIRDFSTKDRSFSFVTSDGNSRYKRLMSASLAQIAQDKGMTLAIEAAKNALSGGPDYSNGAYFRDGADIKSNYASHFKVRHGIKFSDPAHNIYGIPESTVPTKYLYKNVKRQVDGKTVTERTLVDSTDHVYESTAAHGGTIFWKQSESYLRVSRSKEWL